MLRQGAWKPEQRMLCHKLSCQARYLCEQHSRVSRQLPICSLEIYRYVYPVEQMCRVYPTSTPEELQ